jgi:hypothetical protein
VQGSPWKHGGSHFTRPGFAAASFLFARELASQVQEDEVVCAFLAAYHDFSLEFTRELVITWAVARSTPGSIPAFDVALDQGKQMELLSIRDHRIRLCG